MVKRNSFIKFLIIVLIIVELFVIVVLLVNPSFITSLFDGPYRCSDCNVLFITMDALRADHVGAYGYHRNTTPNIDKLAKQGILFENYVVNAPRTFQSLPSIFASKYPIISSILHSDDLDYDIDYFFLPDNTTTLPKVLRANGYYTIALANNNISFTNVFQGFDQSTILNVVDDSKITLKALNIINSSQKKKFFLWVHYISPHSPYRPSFPYNETFYLDEFYDSSRKITNQTIIDGLGNDYLNTSVIDYYISQYDGEIKFVDNEIGSLLKFLKSLNLDRKTLIIISSDHGESLGEHNAFFGHFTLFDTDLKPPFIIYNPKSNIKNVHFVEQVQGVDFYPSILDILDIFVPSNLDGLSFYDLIIGKSYVERIAHSFGNNHYSSLRTNNWKYINYYSGERLYNLAKDPAEKVNLITNYSSLENKLDSNLKDEIDKIRNR